MMFATFFSGLSLFVLIRHNAAFVVQDIYFSPNIYNENISLEEVATVVMSAKSKSACGGDNIPYDVLKYPVVIGVLHKLFQFILDTSIIPSQWRRSIICPILKDSNSDKRIPMNYRGISLQSCISKLYSSVLNRRITQYLTDNEILSDEQNGFRKNRSCEDHVFTLNSIVRNNTTSTFTSYIDLRKCFDFIDRDMLLNISTDRQTDGQTKKSQ
jgi:hypothetical protein